MIVLCFILLLLACDPVTVTLKPDDKPKPTDIQVTLNQNRTKWASEMKPDYRFNFRWICFCVPEYIKLANISVRQNTIDSATFVEDGVPIVAEGLERYQTIEELFDFIQEAIDENAHSISAGYHSELGYPMDVWIDYSAGIADEERGFKIDNLVTE